LALARDPAFRFGGDFDRAVADFVEARFLAAEARFFAGAAFVLADRRRVVA
jgi:hypothetical protein